jgi:hypothetical protein
MKKLTFKLTFVKTVRNSMDYDKLTLLSDGKNRAMTKKHIESIKESIMKFGFLGAIIVIETKAFGKKQLVVVDGQNRYTACVQLGIPINYEIHKLDVDEPLAVTKLISELNTTAKSWSPKNFLTAFVANDIPNYIKFDTIIKAHGFTITDLLHIYLGGGGADANRAFKSGEMDFIAEEDSDLLLKAMIEVKPYVPNLAMCRRVLPKIFRVCGGDYMGLAKQIKAFGKTLKTGGLEYPSNQKEFEKAMKKQLQEFKKAQKEKKKKAA